MSIKKLLTIAFTVTAACLSSAQAQMQETKEVNFSSTEARWLKAKADELKTSVAIYEYLRNTVEHQPYWGSWSGSVNTFAGLRGNNIDIASTMIAMLRSQGIPARYAVSKVRMPSAEITNWLGVDRKEVAIKYLKNAGIADVSQHASLTDMVVMEHVWVEAQVPFNQYRGLPLDTSGVNCQTSPSVCHWIALDASFKKRKYLGKNLDPYASVQWDDTDFNLYFNAIKDNDSRRRDKSVIHILEQDVLDWLRANSAYTGYTLDDVDDRGEIIPALEGLLPASLPYQLENSSVRRYNTVAEHDAAEPDRKWQRKLMVTVYPCHPKQYAGTPTPSTYEISLTEAATERLVISNTAGANNSVNLNLTKGRDANATVAHTWNYSTATCSGLPGQANTTASFTNNSTFWIKLTTDREPGFQWEAPPAIHSATVGSRVLIPVGGETSNWSQVHRAAAALLQSASRYKIVYSAAQVLPGAASCTVSSGSGCIPFVDTTDSGTVGAWDAGDIKLADHPNALQDLQGGLLEVAGAQYFAETREHYKRADGLLRMVTPLRRFVGLVKSNYDVQYLQDATAFSVQPNGLVIDMSFSTGEAIRKASTSLAVDMNHHYFLTFLGSSLEHEVWQKLTGFDAMSTVRSIQVALNAGHQLKTYQRTTTINNSATLASDMGFTLSGGSGTECIDISPARCRASAANSDITKYHAGMVYSLYTDLEDFKPLAAGTSETVGTTIGSQLVSGPAFMKIQMTDKPATGEGFKSQVFIESQTFGTLSTGEMGANITFAINVTGTP